MQIQCSDISFSYPQRPLFTNIHVKFESKKHYWITGPSGSGKTSFLKILCALLNPKQGRILLGNTDLFSLNDKERSAFRKQSIGYLHQENILIDHWTVEQNLGLVVDLNEGWQTLTNELGLKSDIRGQLVSKLSGGERQRVNIARLLLKTPQIALLDEPTSHLDDDNAKKVMNLIKEHFRNSTVVIVSHDRRFSETDFQKIEFNTLIDHKIP